MHLYIYIFFNYINIYILILFLCFLNLYYFIIKYKNLKKIILSTKKVKNLKEKAKFI
jgi:hypothetical protein